MKDMLKSCLNWQVIAGLAVVGVALWALAPGVLSAALPLLVLAICPLSMLFMMKAMQGQQGASTDNSNQPPQPQAEPSPVQVGASADSAGGVQG